MLVVCLTSGRWSIVAIRWGRAIVRRRPELLWLGRSVPTVATGVVWCSMLVEWSIVVGLSCCIGCAGVCGPLPFALVWVVEVMLLLAFVAFLWAVRLTSLVDFVLSPSVVVVLVVAVVLVDPSLGVWNFGSLADFVVLDSSTRFRSVYVFCPQTKRR